MSIQSNTRGFKIFGFGMLLFIITMVLLLIMSVITNSDQPIDHWWVGVVVAVIMAACSLWFSRLMHVISAKQALTCGIVWAIILAGVLLLVAIPNQTAGIIFGQWSTYLVFIGVAVGPVLLKQKPSALKTNIPQ